MSRRRNRSSDVDSALAELRSKKGSQLDAFEDSDEEIYDYLEEEEYSKHVAKNRERAKRFIISDGIVDSTEYQDDGEELWVQENERTEKENIPKKSNKISKKQQSRISGLLLKGSSTVARPKQKKQEIRKSVMSVDTLDSYLNDFDSNPFEETIQEDVPEAPTKKPIFSSNIKSISLSSIKQKPRCVEEAPTQQEKQIPDEDEDEEMSDEESTPVLPPNQTTINFNPSDNTTPKIVKIEPVKPTPITASIPLPKKPSKPIEKVDQSDWFTMCDTKNIEVPSETENMEDISTSETENETTKKIFFLDACYEREIPGTVVLFGKYQPSPKSNVLDSCCVRIENLYRTLYFLPRVFRAKKQIVTETLENGKEIDTEEWIEDNETPVSVRDVCQEFNEIRKRYGIREFRAKPVKKNYCFSLGHIPRKEHEYVKIQFKETASTSKLSDFELVGETFSHVFGVNQNLLERVILKQRLMGPQWIKVTNVIACDRKFSWCKKEWRVQNLSDITPISTQEAPKAPTLTTLSLKINTILNHRKQANEIVIVSAMVHKAVHIDSPTLHWEKSLSSFTALRKLEGVPWPMGFRERIKHQSNAKRQIYLCESESTLLSSLMNFISAVDPDVIVGHNYIGFDLDVLLHRMKANNISTWSRLGRLQRRHMPRLQQGAGGQRDSTWQERKISAGRLICDTYLASKDLAMIRQSSYSLAALAKHQLSMVRYELNQDSLHEYYRNGFSSVQTGVNAKNQTKFLDDRNLDFLIKHNENDTYLQMALMFKFQIIPLTKQLTNLSGNLWSKSLAGSRAERIAFYLLHEFHNRKYITPDKMTFQESTSRKKKTSYTGGLVLAPKRGFYDQLILLLDFNSLYPSLIQEYNICFTTIDPKPKYDEEGNFVPLSELPDDRENRGVLPQVIKTLIDRRRTVKQLIKSERDEIKLQQLDIKQKALKLTANSMYGCLGFPQSRFYAMPLAELITRKGREALTLSKNIAEEKLGFDVVYGDTDSIMVNTGTTDVSKAREMATLIKKSINQKYTKLELDLDGIFKTMLLLKKKKYAALMISPDGKSVIKETKGLDLVRRDWCPLSKEIGQRVLDFILSGDQIDEVLLSIHQYLREMAEKIMEIPLEQFVITKSLSKEPEQYAKTTPLPHVTVALALIQQGKSVRVGNHIPYVICKSLDEEISCSYALRAYHPEHIEKAGGLLEIDFDWYLENQILAPIIRLCDPIDGTSAKRIAECLGIKDSKLANRFSHSHQVDDDRFFKPVAFDDIERFKDAETFSLRCNNCNHSFPFKSIIYKHSSSEEDSEMEFFTGHTCTNENCQMELDYSVVANQLQLFIRKHIQSYYAGWLSCDDPSCCHRTRTILMKSNITKCTAPRCGGKMHLEYTSSQLYNQLCYLQIKFDFNKFKSTVSEEEKLCGEAYGPFYKNLYNLVDQYLTRNAHNFVDCKNLFSCFSNLSLSK